MPDPDSVILPPGPNQRFWREGDRLVIMHGTKLPSTICLGSGQQGVVEHVRRTVRWIHPGVLLGILLFVLFVPLGLLVKLIVVAAAYYGSSKAVVVQYGLGAACRRRRRIGLGIAAVSPAAGAYFLVKSLIEGSDSGVTIGLGMIFAGLIAGVLIAQNFWIVRIKDKKVTMKVKPAVLEGLGLGVP